MHLLSQKHVKEHATHTSNNTISLLEPSKSLPLTEAIKSSFLVTAKQHQQQISSTTPSPHVINLVLRETLSSTFVVRDVTACWGAVAAIDGLANIEKVRPQSPDHRLWQVCQHRRDDESEQQHHDGGPREAKNVDKGVRAQVAIGALTTQFRRNEEKHLYEEADSRR